MITLVAALALGTAACSSTTTPGEPGATKIAIGAADFSFDVPATLTGGLVELTLTNNAEESIHEAQLLSVEDGTTAEDLVPILGGIGEGDPIPEDIGLTGGINATPPSLTTTTTQNLDAGSYAFVCFIDGHFEKGMITLVSVTGGEEGDLPAGSASVNAIDYSFEIAGLADGLNEVTFSNGGQQPHFAAVLGFEEGITVAQVEGEIARFQAGKEAKLPEPEEVGGLPAIDPGGELVTTLNLESGRVYVFLCFLPDRAGGPPHFVKGMAVPVEVA